MAYLGRRGALAPVTAADIPDNSITAAKIVEGTITVGDIGTDAVGTDEIVNDAVTADKLANSINTEISANTAKVTNATHTGDVTGGTALTITDDAVTGGKLANDIAISTTGNIATTSSGTITSAGLITANGGLETDTNSMTMLYDIGGLQTGTYYGYHSQILEGSGDGYAALNDRDGTSIGLLNDIGNASGETVNGLIYFYQPSSTDRIKTSSAHIVCCNTGNDPRGGTSHHNFTNSVAALTGFKLDVASDDFDAGTVTIYGLKN